MMSAEMKQMRAAKFAQRNRVNYVATVLGFPLWPLVCFGYSGF